MKFIRPIVPGRALRALCLLAAVFSAACDGGGTGSTPNPVPALTDVDPEVVAPGSGAFTLTVTGSGFVRGSVVRWNDSPRPTTYVSATRLTASISSADVADYATRNITVFNPAPGGGSSNAQIVIVGVFGATLTDLSPDTVMVEVGGTVTVRGEGFVPGSRVELGLNGFSPPTTFVSATEVRFTLEPANVRLPGQALVSVVRPDNVPSSPLPLIIANPPPVVSLASPAQPAVEQDSQVVRLTGTGFVLSTLVQDVAGGMRTARRINPTTLDVTLIASDLANPGPRTLRVINPGPGGGQVDVPIEVVNPVPTVSSVTPSQVLAGQDSAVVRVTGTGFTRGTVVRVGGEARTTRRVSATQVDVVLTADDLGEGGTLALTAFNAAPGGGTSGAVSVTLDVPEPVITSLPSNGATAGGGGYELVVHGTGFIRSSRIRWNGAERTTRYVSGTRLETTVAASDVATPRTASVTVNTPGGGTSNAEQITVRTPGSAAISGLTVVDVPATDMVYDAARNRIYAVLDATAGDRANTVVAIDPSTGEITASEGVGSGPSAVALSTDGSTLWVASDEAGQVRRYALPGLVPGPAFSLEGDYVSDMEAVPGQPGSVALSLYDPCCSSHVGVAVYDNGVRRPEMAPFNHPANIITFGESAAVIYASNTQSSESGFRTLRVSGTGVTVARVSEDFLLGGNDRVLFAGGRVYTNSGQVIDAARHEQVGVFPDAWGQSSFTVDAELGRAYYFDSSYAEGLRVFDLNTLELLGSAQVDGVESQHPVRSTERLVRWGTNGLALSDGQRIHIFRTDLAGP